MEKGSSTQFNQQMKNRTMNVAFNIHRMVAKKEVSFLTRPIAVQLIRSASSMAANYRSAARGRSDNEFYSKICVVVEECDETEFWIDYLILFGCLNHEETKSIKDELDQLIRIFTSIKRKMKLKLGK